MVIDTSCFSKGKFYLADTARLYWCFNIMEDEDFGTAFYLLDVSQLFSEGEIIHVVRHEGDNVPEIAEISLPQTMVNKLCSSIEAHTSANIFTMIMSGLDSIR